MGKKKKKAKGAEYVDIVPKKRDDKASEPEAADEAVKPEPEVTEPEQTDETPESAAADVADTETEPDAGNDPSTADSDENPDVPNESDEDSEVLSESVEDSEVPDESVEDSKVPDESIEDSEVSDESDKDSEAPNESVNDSDVSDESVEDSEVPDEPIEDSEAPNDSEVLNEPVEDSEVPNEPVEESKVSDKPEKPRRRIPMAVILAVAVVGGALLGLFLFTGMGPHEPAAKHEVPASLTAAEQSAIGSSDIREGEMMISVSERPSATRSSDGSGVMELDLVNSDQNAYAQVATVTVHTDTGDVDVCRTGYVKPGESVQRISCTNLPNPGTYDATVSIQAYDMATRRGVGGAAGAAVTLTVTDTASAPEGSASDGK